MNEPVLQQVGEAVLEEPVRLKYLDRRGKLGTLLQRFGLLPRERELRITPLCLGTMVRISKRILLIEFDRKELGSGYMDLSYRLLQGHGSDVAWIIAAAAVNRNAEPPEALVRSIERNFSQEDLGRALQVVIEQMQLVNFISSIVSIRGLNLLQVETSPSDQGS